MEKPRIITAISDLHGKNIWEKFVKTSYAEKSGKVVFVGDYFDSYDIPVEAQISNFFKILEYKRQNRDKVVLLLGNHELHYLPGVTQRSSGYSETANTRIRGILKKALEEGLLEISYSTGDLIFSHAGFTNTWLKNNKVDIDNLDIEMKRFLYHRPQVFNLAYSEKDDGMTGDDVFQSPLWIRPNSLLADSLDGKTQIIGHTPVKEIQRIDNIIAIDVLDNKNEFLHIGGEKIGVIIKNI